MGTASTGHRRSPAGPSRQGFAATAAATAAAAAVAVVLAAALSGCGGSHHTKPAAAPSTSTSTSTSSIPSTSTSSTSPAGGQQAGSPQAVDAVRRAWSEFFSGSTPAAEKIAVLQDGARFSKIIDGQASSPLAKSASAVVSAVSVHGAQATVSYTVDFDGEPALTGQTGLAVLQAGTWKVGDASFCALLGLERQHPAACSG